MFHSPHLPAAAAKLALLALTALAAASPAYAAGDVDVSALHRGQAYEGFIVGYRDATAGARSANGFAAPRASRRFDRPDQVRLDRGRSVGLRRERTLATGADLVAPDRRLSRADAEQLMRTIAADPAVAYVEPNVMFQVDVGPDVNDTYFNLQYGLKDGFGGTWANYAWLSPWHGEGKIVAVIDTGVIRHPDLSANIINGYDFVSNTFVANDGNARDADASDPGDGYLAGQCGAGVPALNSTWHGTHVAGIVAALTDNGMGVAGVAYGAKVLNVRALGRCGGLLSDITDAIVWASGGTVAGVPAVGSKRASVLNLSLSASGACSATMQQAIDGAVSRNVPVVVSAGNNNADVANFSPASCRNTIVVGATDQAGVRASFSNYGRGVDLSAPGVQIASTVDIGTLAPGGAAYGYKSGTSQAAPFVAATIAIIQSKAAPDPTPAVVEAHLKKWANRNTPTPSVPMGAGILNTLDAVMFPY